jgi:hypothetical protein
VALVLWRIMHSQKTIYGHAMPEIADFLLKIRWRIGAFTQRSMSLNSGLPVPVELFGAKKRFCSADRTRSSMPTQKFLANK